MNRERLATAAVAVAFGAVAVVGGVAALDGPSKGTRYAEVGSPVACIDPLCGTPVALPTVIVEPTTVVDTIDTLPSTGTGSSR